MHPQVQPAEIAQAEKPLEQQLAAAAIAQLASTATLARPAATVLQVGGPPAGPAASTAVQHALQISIDPASPPAAPGALLARSAPADPTL